MYQRLAKADPTLSWSVVTKRRDQSAGSIDGPKRFLAFSRDREEFSSWRNALLELVWTVRQLRSGLLDGVDLVHSAGWSWMAPLILHAARRRRLALIRELTTIGDGGRDSIGGRLIRWTNRMADAVVAISPKLAEAARRTILADTPIWCRPNGVDPQRFSPGDVGVRADARAGLRQWLPQLKDTDIVVLHVGRIRPLKNQLVLAESVARLPARFHLMLAGPAFCSDDEYVMRLRRRLALPDLASRAALVERQFGDVERLMQGADVFAFPSTSEGLGTVMIEALSCGLPVVASRLPGVTDWVVEDGVNGLLSALEPEQFAQKLLAATALTAARPRIAAEAAKTYGQAAMDEGYRALLARVRAFKSPLHAP